MMPTRETSVKLASMGSTPTAPLPAAAAEGAVAWEARLGAVLRVARELRAAVPPPKGAPFYGLDMEVAFDPTVLESLSAPGIFRKYEHVLLLAPGLGGEARWLAARLGCKIVAVDTDLHALTGARLLNERAHMGTVVHFVVGQDRAMPLVERSFTHAWILTATEPPSADVVAEALRVLRPGGHFAVQATGVLSGEATIAWREACRAAGFGAIDERAVPCAGPPPGLRSARLRLAHALELAGTGPLSARCEVPVPDGLWQLHAQRPS